MLRDLGLIERVPRSKRKPSLRSECIQPPVNFDFSISTIWLVGWKRAKNQAVVNPVIPPPTMQNRFGILFEMKK